MIQLHGMVSMGRVIGPWGEPNQSSINLRTFYNSLKSNVRSCQTCLLVNWAPNTGSPTIMADLRASRDPSMVLSLLASPPTIWRGIFQDKALLTFLKLFVIEGFLCCVIFSLCPLKSIFNLRNTLCYLKVLKLQYPYHFWDHQVKEGSICSPAYHPTSH